MSDKDKQIAKTIELPSGAIAHRLRLKGRLFFQFQEMVSSQGTAPALKWIVMQAFEVDGKPITIDALEDEFDFEDVAALSAEINNAFLPFLQAKT